MKSKLESDRYQDLYRQALIAQSRLDAERNPLMHPNPGFYKLEEEKQRELEEKRRQREENKNVG